MTDTKEKYYKEKDYKDYTEQPLGELPNYTPSGYVCHIFGGTGITWEPGIKDLPNSWVRFWSKVFFNCKWVKKTMSDGTQAGI